MDSFPNNSSCKLHTLTYRDLQKLAMTLSIPANLKKDLLCSLIKLAQSGDYESVSKIVEEDRQKKFQLKKCQPKATDLDESTKRKKNITKKYNDCVMYQNVSFFNDNFLEPQGNNFKQTFGRPNIINSEIERQVWNRSIPVDLNTSYSFSEFNPNMLNSPNQFPLPQVAQVEEVSSSAIVPFSKPERSCSSASEDSVLKSLLNSQQHINILNERGVIPTSNLFRPNINTPPPLMLCFPTTPTVPPNTQLQSSLSCSSKLVSSPLPTENLITDINHQLNYCDNNNNYVSSFYNDYHSTFNNNNIDRLKLNTSNELSVNYNRIRKEYGCQNYKPGINLLPQEVLERPHTSTSFSESYDWKLSPFVKNVSVCDVQQEPTDSYSRNTQAAQIVTSSAAAATLAADDSRIESILRHMQQRSNNTSSEVSRSTVTACVLSDSSRNGSFYNDSNNLNSYNFSQSLLVPSVPMRNEDSASLPGLLNSSQYERDDVSGNGNTSGLVLPNFGCNSNTNTVIGNNNIPHSHAYNYFSSTEVQQEIQTVNVANVRDSEVGRSINVFTSVTEAVQGFGNSSTSNDVSGFCRYENYGCTRVIYGAKELMQHESSCTFQPTSCPIEPCNWRSDLNSLNDHFTEAHAEQIISNNSVSLLLPLSSVRNCAQIHIIQSVDQHLFFSTMYRVDHQINVMTQYIKKNAEDNICCEGSLIIIAKNNIPYTWRGAITPYGGSQAMNLRSQGRTLVFDLDSSPELLELLIEISHRDF